MIEQPAKGTFSHEQPSPRASHERALAEEIVSVLMFAGPRVCSAAEAAIRYTVHGSSLRLRSIILDRASLRHLVRDRDRAVKIEYLRRDLLRCAVHSTEYRYPRRALQSWGLHWQLDRRTKESYRG